MHRIIYSKNFIKQYNKLPITIIKKTDKVIFKFKKNPKNPSLKSHKLTGVLSDRYAFSIEHQYRIVFSMNKEEGYFEFLKIGTHKIYQ